eukprot:scaffold10381_cov21-Prasinocladus_malaysianus.AAC.2
MQERWSIAICNNLPERGDACIAATSSRALHASSRMIMGSDCDTDSKCAPSLHWSIRCKA